MTLPDPIREALEDELDEATVARLWRGTRERMEGRASPRWELPRVALGLGVAAAVVSLALWLWPGPAAREPLALAGGGVVSDVRTAAQTRRIELDDASRVELGPRSALSVQRNDADVFTTRLTRGRARFEVTPGTGRRWVIECGIATVEVIGTVFILEQRAEGLWVEVERGRVRVRAPSAEHLLGAGAHLLVPRRTAPRVARRAPETVVDEAEAAAPPAPAPPPPRPERWRALAERGAHREAYSALGSRGIDARVDRASARELMLMADVARLSGHPADAIAPLERLIAEHPRDAQAPLAAVILGRLEMDALERPARAATALERAVSLGVPAALEDDVAGRLAIARIGSGDRARGEADARAYLERHPRGRHAARLRELLER